jgi:hypothetical protein
MGNPMWSRVCAAMRTKSASAAMLLARGTSRSWNSPGPRASTANFSRSRNPRGGNLVVSERIREQ